MILLIDNYDSFTYNLYQAIAKLSAAEVKVVRNDKISLGEITELAPQAIVLSPGPGRPENAGICLEVIKQLAANIPLLGVCLGHQAIGMAFGANVVQANEIVHGKAANILHNQRGLFNTLALPFQAGRYHSLVIERDSLPAELYVTAENEQGLVMGVQHKNLPIYGVQFHPESILTPSGEALVQNFLGLI